MAEIPGQDPQANPADRLPFGTSYPGAGDLQLDVAPQIEMDDPPLTPPSTWQPMTSEVEDSDSSRKPGVRKSMRACEVYAEKSTTTRLHILEFLSQKEWWYNGQNALGFTLVLWIIFIFIMYTRAGVSTSYDLHRSVAQHMENIIAHPHLSGIRVRAVEDNPLPCRCACQSSSAGMPKGPCDAGASETLDFLGQIKKGLPRLTQFSMKAIQEAQIDPAVLGDKLEAGNDDIAPMTWDRISQPKDVWFWIEHGFIPDVWRPRSQSAGNFSVQGLVAQKNLIIGGVRARQKRALWSAVCEDKVSKKLTEFYRTDCRSSEDATSSYGPHITASAGASNETATTTTAQSTTQAPSSVVASSTNAMAFQPSTTSTATGDYDGLFDIELNISDALEAATLCRDYNWVDGATRSVTLQSVSLNAEIGMFALIDIEFKFPSGGGVEKKVRVHTVHAVGSKIEFTDIVPELMWAGMIALLLRQEIAQLLWAGYERKCLDYWLDLWCVVDWFSIFLGCIITVFWLWQMTSIGSISDNIAALPHAPFASGPPADIPAYRAQWQQILEDLTFVYARKQYYQLALFWYALVLTGRFLKGFLSQAKLAMLQLTVGTVFWDLCHLLIFFGTIFLNFQLGGHILFGSQVEDWSTMVKAGATTVRMMLGNYEFDPMYEVAPISAVCWFWSFHFTVIFILMNLIFAMVADYFHVIRKSIGDTDTIVQDTANSVKDLWWRMGWRKINIEDAEYKVALFENPYNEVLEGLMEASEVPSSLERDAGHTCLGVRLGRRRMEAQSVEGLSDKENAGFAPATSKGIQELGADIMAADHLLELTAPHVAIETKRNNESQLTMVRHFVDLIRHHRIDMDAHCAALEAEITDDHSILVKHVDTLVDSVGDCLVEFERLKEDGVHSLAPPLQALPRPGTLAALSAQQQSMVAPGALLRAIDISEHPVNKQARDQGRQPPELPQLGNNTANAMLMNSPNAAMRALGNAPAPGAFDKQGALQLQDVAKPPRRPRVDNNAQAALPDNAQPSSPAGPPASAIMDA